MRIRVMIRREKGEIISFDSLLTYNGNHAFKFVDRFFVHFEIVNSYSDFIEFRFLVGKNLNFYEIFFFFLYFFEFFS